MNTGIVHENDLGGTYRSVQKMLQVVEEQSGHE